MQLFLSPQGCMHLGRRCNGTKNQKVWLVDRVFWLFHNDWWKCIVATWCFSAHIWEELSQFGWVSVCSIPKTDRITQFPVTIDYHDILAPPIRTSFWAIFVLVSFMASQMVNVLHKVVFAVLKCFPHTIFNHWTKLAGQVSIIQFVDDFMWEQSFGKGFPVHFKHCASFLVFSIFSINSFLMCIFSGSLLHLWLKVRANPGVEVEESSHIWDLCRIFKCFRKLFVKRELQR